MRSSRFALLALAAVALAGCMQTAGPDSLARDDTTPSSGQVSLPAFLRPAPVRAAVVQPLPQQVASEPMMLQDAALEQQQKGYTLDSGDKLRVVVFGQDGLSASYSVDTGGNITMPLIGAVPARGKTTAQLQQAIGAKLRDGYIREPHVAAEVEAYRPFFILGEVTLPGQYPYVANMTVETAVAIAGGFTPRAQKWRIEVSHPVSGVTETLVVSPDYPVRPGDTVKIAERWF